MNNEMRILARTIYDKGHETAKNVVKNTGISLDFGTVTSTGLKLDSFKYEINDYMILDYLTLDKDYFTQTDNSDDHSHKVVTPEGLKPLKAGDRVLTAQVGSETVILGRVS